jgi:hypothetical protein
MMFCSPRTPSGAALISKGYRGRHNTQLDLNSGRAPKLWWRYHRRYLARGAGQMGVARVGLCIDVHLVIRSRLGIYAQHVVGRTGGVGAGAGKYMIGTLCLLAGNLWTLVVMTVWSVGCFYAVLKNYYGGEGSVWPYLLWAYGMATGPWTYMAARGGPNENGSAMGAFGACVGAIAIMGIIIFKDSPSILDATIAFCIPILVVLVFQTWLSFMVAREEARARRDAPEPAA